MEPRHARFIWLAGARGLAPPEPLAGWLAGRTVDPDAAPVGLVDARAGLEPGLGATVPSDALAVVDAGAGEAALAAASRLGADDLIDLTEPDGRWRHRLAQLADLAQMRREAGRRRATAVAFSNRPPAPPAPTTERPPVLFVGAAGGDQLLVVDALSGWTVPAYAGTVEHGRRHLENGLYAAVVASDLVDARALEATLAPLVTIEGPSAPSFVVVRPRRAPYGAELAFRLGAHEVLERDLPIDLIQRRLARAVQDAALRIELREHHAFAGAADPVTGRVDHGAFHAHVEQLLRLGAHPTAALVAVSLDGLDEVNRAAGFAAGDRALAAIGHGLARALRAVDCLGRLGGASFGVWIEPIDDAALEELAARLGDRVRRATAGDAGPPVTARVGWARPQPGDDALTLTRRARDEARRTLLRATG